ncbi:MAG TPA: hypothetical protein VIP77_12030 [Jiangellaceae bacterium]
MSALKEIRDRASAATPGPWTWRGNVDTRQIYLSYTKPGLGWTSVMDFVRWGMQSARPRFLTENFWMQDADDLAVFEVCREAKRRNDPRVYRGDIVGFRHPDAEFIANARQDVDDLLARIDAVEAICARHEEGATRWEDPLPMPEWIAEVRGALEGVAS